MRSFLQLVVPYHRRRRMRTLALRPIDSYKQVTVDGPASRASATNIFHILVHGVDNYVGPTALNNEVPTGAKVFGILILATFTNLVSISSLLHFNVMTNRSGGVIPTPGAVGGNPNRNKVIHTDMIFLGQNQNNNIRLFVKIPKIYQRIREDDEILIQYRADTVFASATQAIYKFYR